MYSWLADGNGAFNSFSQRKEELDEKLHKKLPRMTSWVIYDLRRTARSLMSRAGVRPDISERIMGHAIPGIEGVYDRHSYSEEKADGLNRLASLIGQIINPPPKAKVSQLDETGARKTCQAMTDQTLPRLRRRLVFCSYVILGR